MLYFCRAISLVLLITTSLNSFATEKSISAESFGKLAQSSSIKISPDGSKIASFRNYLGKKTLVTRSLNNNEQHILSFDEGEYNWFKWISNERLVFGIKFASKRGRTETIETRLFAINWDKTSVINLIKKQKVRTGKGVTTEVKFSQLQDKVISFLPHDPDHILVALDQSIANYPDVFKINVHTAKRERLIKNVRNVSQWFSDSQGVVRVGYVRSKSMRDRWIFRKNADENWQTIARMDSETMLMPFNFEAFDNENPELIYVSATSTNNRLSFFKYDTKLAKLGDSIAEQKNADINSLLINNNGDIYGYTYMDDYPHRVYSNKFWRSIQKMLNNNFPDSLIRVESFSENRKKIFIHVSSPTIPGEYYFLDLKEGSLTLYSEQFPSIDNNKLAKMHFVNYQARDGLTIPAFLSLPNQLTPENAKSLPTIIMPHGGPKARDYWGYDYWVQFLTARGYSVLQMNYRGSTGYSDEYTDKGKHQWGGAMIDDINDGTQWLIEQKIADPQRICIMGWSYGGYAALQAPIKSKETYKCSVAGAAVSNMPSLMFYQKQFTGYKRYKHYVNNDETSLTDISPYHQLDKLNLPILMFHGNKDRSVPYKQSIEFVDEMKEKGKTIKFVNLDKADHHLSREKDRILFLQEVEVFLNQHLN